MCIGASALGGFSSGKEGKGHVSVPLGTRPDPLLLLSPMCESWQPSHLVGVGAGAGGFSQTHRWLTPSLAAGGGSGPTLGPLITASGHRMSARSLSRPPNRPHRVPLTHSTGHPVLALVEMYDPSSTVGLSRFECPHHSLGG